MQLSPWTLIALAILPDQLQAQVLAGDTTGLAHTEVNTLISSPFGPGFNGDDATLHMGITGTMDLFLFAGNTHTTWDDGAWTQVNPTPSGMEVASSQPGSFIATRFDSLAQVNASLAWVGYAELLGDQLVLASLTRDTNDPNNWIGMGQWFESEGDTTQGFLAVRFPQPTDTLYGWLRLTSYVTRDSSWLRVHDFAIETSTINSANEQFMSSHITAFFDANGSLQIRGGEIGRSMQVTVRDFAGRVLASRTIVWPAAVDVPNSSHGIYTITVSHDEETKTFNLVR